MKKHYPLCLLIGLFVTVCVARAENWPQWRGPAFNGTSPETNLPDKLDETGTMAWSVELPGRGASTPIVWGNQVFLTTQGKDRKLLALCFDAKTGKEQWRKEMGMAGQAKGNNADWAGPSAITDGKTVYFYFSTGDLAAFDMDGKPIWNLNMQKEHGTFNYQWIYGSSPLLYRGKLYVQVLQRDVPGSEWRAAKAGESLADSYIVAKEPSTGKDIWKVVRKDDNARVESKEAYSTPMPYQGKEPAQIIIVGGDCVTGHDFDTGKEIWRAGGWNPQKIDSFRTVPSVTVAGDMIIACAPKGGPVMGIKPGEGDVTASNFAWKSKELTSDVTVPAFYQGNLYVLEGEKKALSCVDAKTGEKKWSTKLDSRPVFRASPTAADGKIYCINENGEVWVCSASESKIISQGTLSNRDKAHASISVADGRVYVRTGEKLYAFGKK
ncbi:MAG TPA: PQQ-binding-like beta-propeller repeat protein [Tepidisphaeraceae bacterium]|jgi:outer membrane protein assembly factor BamB|nr:PQQ-binding-like beta-propeller repeat protein [Tepidisphaeraceae bacterium]